MRWLPKAISTIVLWGVVFYIVLFIDPVLLQDVLIEGVYLPFLVALFLAVFYSLSLAFQSMRLGLGISLILMLLVVLNILRFLTWPTVVIAVGLVGIMVWGRFKKR